MTKLSAQLSVDTPTSSTDGTVRSIRPAAPRHRGPQLGHHVGVGGVVGDDQADPRVGRTWPGRSGPTWCGRRSRSTRSHTAAIAAFISTSWRFASVSPRLTVRPSGAKKAERGVHFGEQIGCRPPVKRNGRGAQLRHRSEWCSPGSFQQLERGVHPVGHHGDVVQRRPAAQARGRPGAPWCWRRASQADHPPPARPPRDQSAASARRCSPRAWRT